MGDLFDRDRAFFYGQFVQAAYAMYRDPKGDPLKPEPQGIPDGWEVGAWVQMSDFLLTFKEPEFYGIICRKSDEPDRRVLAIRGTESAIEWLDDAAALPTKFRQVPTAGQVASGFDRIYSSMKVVKRKLAEDGALREGEPILAAQETYSGSFADQVDQLATSREIRRGKRRTLTEERPQRPMVVTGHSLGAALATLFVMENASKKRFDIETSCTFASPRVGNLEFARAFDQLPITSWRVVNTLDIVPKLPPKIPLLLDYDHVDTAEPFTSSDFAKNSLVCWHVMETYMHWLKDSYPLRAECVK